MKIDLESSVSIVTSADAGLGKPLAKASAASSASVFANDLANAGEVTARPLRLKHSPRFGKSPFYGLAQIRLRSARVALQRFRQMFRGLRLS